MFLPILLCVTLLPFAFAFEPISTTCLPQEEVDALKEIGRTLVKKWNFEQDPCDWEKCTEDDYENHLTCSGKPICHVTYISLAGQNLQGTLPPALIKLPYLQNLNLSRNNLGGTIPPEWGSMEQIVNINLRVNRLNGSIPKELGNISTLKSLVVEDNRMSGPIPAELGKLTGIQRLLLNSNFFTRELPASFANLTSMTEFGISSNNLSGK